jgi:glycosyltransferase involved in cell wall biosynthesis
VSSVGPTWSILVPTIPQREESFRRLMGILLPQLAEHRGAVRVIAWRNAGEKTVGELRDALLAASDADYVCFIDDDDLIPEYYVTEIMIALSTRPHHVGFQLAYYLDGRLEEIVDHSLRHQGWERTSEGRLVRDFTHIDPILRETAQAGRFAQARRYRAEDRAWCKQVRPHLQGRPEAYIDKIMYHYLWAPAESSWRRQDRVRPAETPLPSFGSPHFTWHPESR